MRPEAEAIYEKREYAHSHQTARGLMLFGLVCFLFGSFLIVSQRGPYGDTKGLVFGGLAIAVALAAFFIGYRTGRQPSVARIVLSAEGVLFRDVSDRLIPWHDVKDVGTADVMMEGDINSTKVTKLVVSRAFIQSLDLSSPFDSRIVRVGEPSEIYLSYYHKLPVDEFHAAVLSRWQAFHKRK